MIKKSPHLFFLNNNKLVLQELTDQYLLDHYFELYDDQIKHVTIKHVTINKFLNNSVLTYLSFDNAIHTINSIMKQHPITFKEFADSITDNAKPELNIKNETHKFIHDEIGHHLRIPVINDKNYICPESMNYIQNYNQIIDAVKEHLKITSDEDKMIIN
jgi:hypothetical protein